MRPGIRGSAEPDRPCLGGCGQLLMAAAWDAAHGHCPACWNRVRSPGGLRQEAEEAAARIGILRHDGRYPDFIAGYTEVMEVLGLEEVGEPDPDVADTAWAIIAHHRQHRTAG